MRKLLRESGAKTVKYHGNEFTTNGTPDLLSCLRGRFVAIEMKGPGDKPDELQIVELRQWIQSGAIALYTDEPAEAFHFVSEMLEHSFAETRRRCHARLDAQLGT